MKHSRSLKFLAVLLGLMLVAAACGGGGKGSDAPKDSGKDELGVAKKGGTYRVGTDAYEWNAALDPSGEYLGTAWAIYSNMLHRPLVGYKHVSGDEGNELVPDSAEELPEVSDDGLTYTFKIKPGVKFAPPVDRDVTADDFIYAFERIATESVVAQYGFYYTPFVEGMQEFSDGKADTISGITATDDQTLEIKLTGPVGDWLYRMSMPATAPMPREVGECWEKAGEYGSYQIATGPYMLEGTDELDITSCKTMKPISGFDPNKHVKLVRNPNYDESTDSPENRENFIDRWEMTLNTNTQDIFDKIEAGELEGEVAAPPPQTLRKYSQGSDELKKHLHAEQGDRTWYITMNLTQPPFDDIHVRKALNYVMDKDGLHRAWGGEIRGSIHGHIIPDLMLDSLLDDYDPYGSEDQAGDEEKAKEEMKQSKYDTDQDGVCDAPECKKILHITRDTPPWSEMGPVIEESAAKIGLELTTRPSEDSYTVIQDVSKNVPVASNAGWGKDYNDPSTFMVLFDSRSILATGNINYSLIGLDKTKLDELAKGAAEADPPVKFNFKGNVDGIPKIDDDIDACIEKSAEEITQCWADLDTKLMEEIVPWVPYLDATNIDITGPAVTKYEYDQFSGEAAWSHVAVDPSKQKGL